MHHNVLTSRIIYSLSSEKAAIENMFWFNNVEKLLHIWDEPVVYWWCLKLHHPEVNFTEVEDWSTYNKTSQPRHAAALMNLNQLCSE